MRADRANFGIAAPRLSRRRFALLPLVLGAGGWTATGAAAAVLPAPQSLAVELASALRQAKPLLVMASLNGCPFCKMVRDSYLAPLVRDDGQPVVQLDIGSRSLVYGFDGVLASHDAVLRAWGVRAAPTVLFFGSQGREVAQRLAGASIPDFYGAYLDERLRTARRSLG